MKTKKWVRNRHKFYTFVFRGLLKPIFKLICNIKAYKYKIPKDENVFIISNHQTDIDPIFVGFSMNKPLYYIATDSLFSSKLAAGFLNHCFAPIPKKKGLSDPFCIKTILRVAKEKGSICLFAEGNRTYAEFQYYIDPSLAKLIKALKMPLILYNISGGSGVYPRFGKKKRRGKIEGKVVERIEVEDLLKMSDEQIIEKIKETIKVYDSDSKNLYKSKSRAEYLERMLFVCPCCHKMNTIYSKNEYVYCSNCDLKVEYLENLHLKSTNDSCNFDRLVDWYDFQKQYLKDISFDDNQEICVDEIKLYQSNVNKPRKLLFKGKMILNNKELVFENYLTIPLIDIIIASPIGGVKFNFSTNEKNYLVIGNERFNPLKYVLLFNKLDTTMHNKHIDSYFTLD